MAKLRDMVWYCDDDGEKRVASVTRAQTLVDGLPAPGSYDADTVDLSVYAENEETVNGASVIHRMIEGGVTAAKLAKTTTDQKTPGHWWPKA